MMLINDKFKPFILSVFLFSTQSVFAKQTEVERVNTIAQSLISSFSGLSNQTSSSLKMTAAMEGVSESDIQKRFDESGSKPQSNSEKMFEILKQQYNAKDLKVIGPAFQKQMVAQGAVYNSCKIDGNPKKK